MTLTITTTHHGWGERSVPMFPQHYTFVKARCRILIMHWATTPKYSPFFAVLGGNVCIVPCFDYWPPPQHIVVGSGVNAHVLTALQHAEMSVSILVMYRNVAHKNGEKRRAITFFVLWMCVRRIFCKNQPKSQLSDFFCLLIHSFPVLPLQADQGTSWLYRSRPD